MICWYVHVSETSKSWSMMLSIQPIKGKTPSWVSMDVFFNPLNGHQTRHCSMRLHLPWASWWGAFLDKTIGNMTRKILWDLWYRDKTYPSSQLISRLKTILYCFLILRAPKRAGMHFKSLQCSLLWFIAGFCLFETGIPFHGLADDVSSVP